MPHDEQAKAQAEEYLAELPDDEFAQLLKRVRPPDDDPKQAFAEFLSQQRQRKGHHS